MASCYSKTASGSDPSGLQQGCNTRIALCRVQAARRTKLRAEGGGGRPRLDSEHHREKVECLAGALLVEGGRESCLSTVVDNALRDAHLTVGMFLLCEEWDVDEALLHFSAAASTSRQRQESLPEEEDSRGGGESVPSRDGTEWGPVWLLQVRACLRLTMCRPVRSGKCTHSVNGFGGPRSSEYGTVLLCASIVPLKILVYLPLSRVVDLVLLMSSKPLPNSELYVSAQMVRGGHRTYCIHGSLTLETQTGGNYMQSFDK